MSSLPAPTKALTPGRLLARVALGGALIGSLSAGTAKATLNCTFGSTSGCTSSPEVNLSFSNFSFSGSGAESADAIQIQKSGIYYIISLTAGGTGSFDTSANLSFDISALNGYKLETAAANSTMAPLTNFVFTYASDKFAAPGNITTQGSFSSFINFLPNTSSATITLSWGAVGGAVAQGTAFYFTMSDPDPVPGPLPLLGAATAFGLSRRLRRRIQARA